MKLKQIKIKDQVSFQSLCDMVCDIEGIVVYPQYDGNPYLVLLELKAGNFYLIENQADGN